MSATRNWKKSLNRQERSKLAELEREIELQEQLVTERRRSIKERNKLIVLKYHRKMLQNRVTVRARRSSEGGSVQPQQ